MLTCVLYEILSKHPWRLALRVRFAGNVTMRKARPNEIGLFATVPALAAERRHDLTTDTSSTDVHYTSLGLIYIGFLPRKYKRKNGDEDSLLPGGGD